MTTTMINCRNLGRPFGDLCTKRPQPAGSAGWDVESGSDQSRPTKLKVSSSWTSTWLPSSRVTSTS